MKLSVLLMYSISVEFCYLFINISLFNVYDGNRDMPIYKIIKEDSLRNNRTLSNAITPVTIYSIFDECSILRLRNNV